MEITIYLSLAQHKKKEKFGDVFFLHFTKAIPKVLSHPKACSSILFFWFLLRNKSHFLSIKKDLRKKREIFEKKKKGKKKKGKKIK